MRVDKSKWEKKNLIDICDIQMGQSPDSSSYNKNKEGLPFYQGNADFGKIHPTPRVYCNAPTRIADQGDLLISVRAPIGAINIANTKCCIGRGLASIKPIERCSYIPFLRFLLLSKNSELNLRGTGMTFKAINKKSLYEIPVVCPPLSEQQGIAAELDAIQAMIDGYREQLADLDALAQSIFLDTFGDPILNPKGWEIACLGNECEISSAKRVLVQDMVKNGIPFIRGTELAILSKNNNFEESLFSLFITQEHYDKVKSITGVPKVGDLLIPSINSEGYVWRVNTNKKLYFKDGRVLWVHTNDEKFNSFWLKYTVSKLIQNLYLYLPRGAVFTELTLIKLRNLNIPIPPLPLQQQFAAQVEAIEKQKELLRQQIADAETLMAERMQYYFS